MNKLSGKVAYITGASKGIGEAIAIELGRLGASVIVGFNNDLEGAKRVVNTIKENNGYAVVLKGDISKSNDILDIKDFIEKKFGKLDILVNNAGISNLGLFMDYSLDDIDNLINVNLTGTMKLTNALFDLIREGKNQSIINISSIWGNVGASCEVLYSASKGGINLFTKALAKEVASLGIRVNAVAPGVINTKMNSWLKDDEKKDLEDEIPLNRFGETSEISKVVAFLCSDDSSYLTGQIITVDGGML